MTTKITLPITITLEDPRYCTGCHFKHGGYCAAHRTKGTNFGRVLYADKAKRHFKRLPQCIAAAKEVE